MSRGSSALPQLQSFNRKVGEEKPNVESRYERIRERTELRRDAGVRVSGDTGEFSLGASIGINPIDGGNLVLKDLLKLGESRPLHCQSHQPPRGFHFPRNHSRRLARTVRQRITSVGAASSGFLTCPFAKIAIWLEISQMKVHRILASRNRQVWPLTVKDWALFAGR
jgi:hypothetical protein